MHLFVWYRDIYWYNILIAAKELENGKIIHHKLCVITFKIVKKYIRCNACPLKIEWWWSPIQFECVYKNNSNLLLVLVKIIYSKTIQFLNIVNTSTFLQKRNIKPIENEWDRVEEINLFVARIAYDIILDFDPWVHGLTLHLITK